MHFSGCDLTHRSRRYISFLMSHTRKPILKSPIGSQDRSSILISEKPESENEKRGKCKQYLSSIENILFFITNQARTALPADTLKSCQTISSTSRSTPIGGRKYFSGCALTPGAGSAPARGAPPS